VYYKGVHGKLISLYMLHSFPFEVHSQELVNFVGCCAADLNETYFVGNVNEESCQLVKCTYECLEKAISIGIYSYDFNSEVSVLDLLFVFCLTSTLKVQYEFITQTTNLVFKLLIWSYLLISIF